MADQYVSVVINGVKVERMKVLEAKHDGFCRFHRRKFKAGQQIVYKHKSSLTPIQKGAIFPDGNIYDLTVIWPLEQAEGPELDQAALAKIEESLEEAKPEKEHKLSPYQEAIMTSMLKGLKHLFVEALAGCAKTSTLIRLCRELGKRGLTKGKNCVYLAFNATIKDEVRPLLRGTGVRGYTTHGWMLTSLLTKRFPELDPENCVNEYLPDDIFEQLIANEMGLDAGDSSRWKVRKAPKYRMHQGVIELVSYLKNWCILPVFEDGAWVFNDESRELIADLIDEYAIVVEPGFTPEQYVEYACRVASACVPLPGQAKKSIDFDDMLWLPLVMDLEFPKVDMVLTDESQDFNACQVEMLRRLIARGARVVVVGDEFQAIYRFRGADCRAFQRIREMLEGTRRGVEIMPLPVNYRSYRAIIRNAQKRVPALQGFRQEEGEVRTDIRFLQMEDMLLTKDGDTNAVLCRVNAPLVTGAFHTMAKMLTLPVPDRKKVVILGRKGFVGPLMNIINSCCGTSSAQDDYTDRISDRRGDKGELLEKGFLSRLADYLRMQREKLSDRKYAQRLDEVMNNVECLSVIANNIRDDKVSTIRKEIDSLVVENISKKELPNTVVYTTVHRAKGLEWDSVYIIKPDLLPHPLAKANEDGSWSDEQQQEENACYIAETRPRKRLAYVPDWPFEQRQQEVGAVAPLEQVAPEEGVNPFAPVEEEVMKYKPPQVRSQGPARRATDIQKPAEDYEPMPASVQPDDLEDDSINDRADWEDEEEVKPVPQKRFTVVPPKQEQEPERRIVVIPPKKGLVPLGTVQGKVKRYVDDGRPF